MNMSRLLLLCVVLSCVKIEAAELTTAPFSLKHSVAIGGAFAGAPIAVDSILTGLGCESALIRVPLGMMASLAALVWMGDHCGYNDKTLSALPTDDLSRCIGTTILLCRYL